MHLTIAPGDPCTRIGVPNRGGRRRVEDSFCPSASQQVRGTWDGEKLARSLDLPEALYKQVAGALVAFAWAKEMFRAACT